MDTVTETTTGRLRGDVAEGGIRDFRGVPFAHPPLGPLRFAPPQPAGAPAMRFAAAHGSPTFAYLFCWSSPMGMLGAAHAIELPFVFGTLDAPMIELFAGGGPEAEQLSTIVQGAWTAFARTGDPSTQELGLWPRFDHHQRSTMVLGADNEMQHPPRAAELDCWELEGQPTAVDAPSAWAAKEVWA